MRRKEDTLEAETILLRNFKESDAFALYELCQDAGVQRSGIPTFDLVDECLNTIQVWKEDNGVKAIVCKEDGELAGFICLGDMNRYDGYKELEYAIAPQYRNRGYATQALKCMVDYGFGKQKVSVIAAWVRSHNKASAAVLERCGFTLEGRLRRHARDKSDTLCYSILKEEWEQSQIR